MDRRSFLLTAAAVAAAPAALAKSAPLDAKAVRLSPKAVRVSWTGKATPASVYVSSDPDAPRFFMRQLRTGVAGGADLAVQIAPRPYFLVADAAGGQTRVAERLLPLQGGRNFRDLGGYRSADGRQVRWGRIYRSGVMSGLTLEDLKYLSSLGIEVICDLRSIQERTAEPTPFLKTDETRVAAHDYELGASLNGIYRATNRAEAVQAFAESYLQFIDMLTPQYADMFDHLVRRETPLAMNCSAGKDRTGMGSALVLSVLGVPRNTVIADYALSQTYVPTTTYTKQVKTGAPMSGVSNSQAKAFGGMPPEVLNVLMGSDPDVMRIALKMVDDKFGGPVELAKARFGLTDAKVARLRETYLI